MSNLPVTIYSPESPLRHPLGMMRAMLRDLGASRELAWRLFLRDMSAQYRQSVLGYFWAIIPPLFASLPFIFLNSQGVIAIKGTGIPYAAFAFIGTITWQVFADAVNSPLRTVIASKAMLVRVNFPREAILLAGLGQVIFNFLIRLPLLAGVFLWYKIDMPMTAFLFPLGVLSLLMIGFMFGLLATPIGLLYSDIQQMIPILTTFLMFFTPVLYPKPTTNFAGTLSDWNPLTTLVVASRDWLTKGSFDQMSSFFLILGVTTLLLFLGWLAFRVALPHIIGRIGN